jgi:two-component system, OmpR family, alkaline phosphatase synthesis response regulator PhoP
LNQKRKILIVDDEPDILEILEYNLKQEGYLIYKAKDGLEAVKKADTHLPDLIIMDVMMPNMDGIEAGRIIKSKKEHKDVHLIFLSARNEEYTEIAAFNIGANDFINKPVKIRSLIGRIDAHFKRLDDLSAVPKVVSYGDFEINQENYSMSIDGGKQIILPKKEFKLLKFLADKPNRVFSRDEILDKIWGQNEIVIDRTIDVHVRKLRKKIGKDYIKTLKGVGYMFSMD